MADEARFVPLETETPSDEEILRRAREFREAMASRRTVRDFDDRPVSREVVEELLRTAGSAPSGANIQPWTFVPVSDPSVKRMIRGAAEDEEREFYESRAPEQWLEALRPLGTDWRKPFLETAPWLVAVFVQKYGLDEKGERIPHYYATESVGLATGLLIAAVHRAGLVALTHTPSPMGFLNEILDRPDNERPFLLLVVGHPAEGVEVPDIERKPLDEIAVFVPPREE
ncbi:MAG: nitroreductase family protein [Gemmatimonadota bacterium]|nr:nitroreductase family protein [Gemmatimonadota bacterium]